MAKQLPGDVEPEVDPTELELARGYWHAFTVWTKWSVIIVSALLILLAIFLV